MGKEKVGEKASKKRKDDKPAATADAAESAKKPAKEKKGKEVDDAPANKKATKKDKKVKASTKEEKKKSANGEADGVKKKSKSKKRKADEPEASADGEKKAKSKRRKAAEPEPETEEAAEVQADAADGAADLPAPEAAFAKFRISSATVQKLLQRGVTHLFPIQEASFDPIYDGKDVLGRARTGTGKTLSFALPIVERLQEKPSGSKRAPRALVLAPTRELAKQVCGDFVSISSGLAATCIYGGTPYYAQENELRRGVDVVVGTPGRVLDHLERGNLVVEALEYLVLDEADQMLDIGFKDAIEAVLRAITHPHQTLLYSATVPDWVRNTAQAHMRADKVTIDLVKDEDVKTSTLIEHLAVRCHWQDRQATLKDILLLYSGAHGRTIVFTETKREANELALKADLKGAQALHGDIPQQQRETTLQGFRAGTFRVLIATDVAARGLDIPEVDVVVQCEPPQDVDTYVHRSGRTGRAGKSGVCIVFYKPAQEYLLANIERRTGAKFRRIGAPQPADIMRAVGRDAKKAIERVPDTVLPYFEQIADEMIASHGATRALAAALAHVSGVTQIEKRSLLNSATGFTTFEMRVSQEMRGTGYVWNILERHLNQELKDAVRGMRMAADRKAAVFDIPNDKVELVEELWKDGYSATLAQCETLPPLVDLPNNNSRPSSPGHMRGGFHSRGNSPAYRGRGGGGGGGGGYGRGGGTSRGGFHSAGSSSSRGRGRGRGR